MQEKRIRRTRSWSEQLARRAQIETAERKEKTGMNNRDQIAASM